MLETKLGFKLKLTADGEKEHLWEARFIFDPNEVSSSKYVSFTYDDRSESFKCKQLDRICIFRYFFINFINIFFFLSGLHETRTKALPADGSIFRRD